MKKKTFIFSILYIAYTAIYIARLNLSMASPVFMELEIADAAQIGILGSVFAAVYACGRLINGSLGDKVPPWIMICTGLIIAGVSNISIGFMPPFIGMAVLWGANAYAQSMLWSSILAAISAIHEEKKAKKLISYMVSSCAMGNILGIALNTWIIDKLGVNFAFVIPGGFTLLISIPVLIAIKKVKPVYRREEKHASVIQLLKNREILKIIVPVVFHGAIKDNISLWMTVYFVEVFSIDLNSTAGFILFIPIVGFIGRMVYPALYKACREKEHLVSVTAFGLCAVLSLPLCFEIKSAVIAVVCLSLIYALISVINTSMLSIYPMRYTETGNVSSVSGLMDFATYGGAGISSAVYGAAIKYLGYVPMYASWAIISAVSVFILYRIAFSKGEKKHEKVSAA